jgi:hypothetical protein
MKKKSSSNSSYFTRLILWLKNLLLLFKKRNRRLSKIFPYLLQTIQLTFAYFFAMMTLFYSVTAMLCSIPEFFEMVMPPFMTELIKSPVVRQALSPERTYFLYIFVFEFIIFRSIFNFSKLFKYNLLLIFILEMMQNLAIGYWDVIFNRQFLNETPSVDIVVAIYIITFIHIVIFFSYIYSYCSAVLGKYTSFPYMDWLTDSICFWLRIKTPRMGKK